MIAVYGAPSYDVKEELTLLRQQLDQIERQLGLESESDNLPVVFPKPFKSGDKVRRQLAWQPMKRSLSWQPMKKKSIDNYYDNREEVINILENRLMEVLSAGERLGVSAGDVIEHLRRSRNTM
uniref:Uncharacterized protein n=1 Tax=Strongyloides stercoralis TaxID=6248 RepID=A0A0K0E7X2_STRER